MRFQIPPELIPKLRELQAQGQRRFFDKVVESEDAVVMTYGLGDSMYLTLDGRVLIDDWDYPDDDKLRYAENAKEMFIAVVIGAKMRRTPELLSLLPLRPDNAVDCTDCKGKGWLFIGLDVNGEPIEIVCHECGALGWFNHG